MTDVSNNTPHTSGEKEKGGGEEEEKEKTEHSTKSWVEMEGLLLTLMGR